MSKYRLGNSLWYETTPRTAYDAVSADETADVAIIGGGLVALHAAYALLKSGRKVTIYERNRIAVWASGSAAAKVASSHAYLFGAIQKRYGYEAAAQYAASNLAGFKRITDLIAAHDIACDFTPNDNYVYASSAKRVKRLRAEYETFAEIGMKVEWVEHIDEKISPFKNWGGLVQRDQAVYHPRKFALALSEEVVKLGGVIRERAKITSLKTEKDGSVVLRVKDEFEVRAKEVIIATKQAPDFLSDFDDVLNEWSAKVFVYEEEAIRYKNSFYGFSKTVGSYRPHHDGATKKNYLLVTGNKPGYMKEQIGYGDTPVYHWQCEDTETIDMLPLIGRVSPKINNVYLAIGFNGWGMTTSAYVGLLLSSLIAGDESFESYLKDAAHELKPKYAAHCHAAEVAALLSPLNKKRHANWEQALKVQPKIANPKMQKLWAEK